MTMLQEKEATAAALRTCDDCLREARHVMQDARWAFDAQPNAFNWEALHRATLGYQESFFAHREALAHLRRTAEK